MKRNSIFFALIGLLIASPQFSLASGQAAQNTKTLSPKVLKSLLPKQGYKVAASSSETQGLGPYALAITKDGKYAYVSIVLSPAIFKIRLEDMVVAETADMSAYWPFETLNMALDISEKKLFVPVPARRKMLVIDTETMSLVHIIDDYGSIGMFRSQFGARLITWDGGGAVRFVDTETYAVAIEEHEGLFILKIQEYEENQNKWYVVAQGLSGGQGLLTVGLYDHVAKSWSNSVSFPKQVAGEGIFDFRVLPDGQKAYVATLGGFYPEAHAFGCLYAVDLEAQQVKVVPIDGGAFCLEANPAGTELYVGTGWPKPNSNNLLVVDTAADCIVGSIPLGRNIYGNPHTQMNNLQIDPANTNLLYATGGDANDFIKVDLGSRTLVDALVFNRGSFMPHYFARRPGQSSGYVLASGSPYGFEINLDTAAIQNTVTFPSIRQDAGAYDIGVLNTGRLLITQGEYFLEVDPQNMQLIATHPHPPDIPSMWHFVLSKDKTKIYAVTYSPDGTINIFLAINATSFQLEKQFYLPGGDFHFRPFVFPDDSKLYALGGLSNGPVVIHVIDTDTYTIQKTITFEEPGLLGMGAGPGDQYAYDPNSHTLYVGATFVILAIDTITDEIKQVIHLEDVARAIGLEPNQLTYTIAGCLVYNPQENYLYIAHVDYCFGSIYDLNNNQFLPQVILLNGFFPTYMFANDNVSKIYVVNAASDNISVIDVITKTLEKVIDLHHYTDKLCLASPIGGEFWKVGETRDITWASDGTLGNVRIEYSTNKGEDWATIIASTSNDSSHPWTVPNTPSTQCLVRVSEATTGAWADMGDAVFTISAGVPTIKLSRTSLSFGSEQNGTPTPAETAIITNTGTGTLSWTLAVSANWISAAPASGTGAGLLTIGIARTDLSPGAYQGTVTVSDPGAANSPQVITVHYQVISPGEDGVPFGVIETPVPGAVIVSSIAVTGWALDDVGMQSVKIYRGTGLADRVYIGDATFVEGARMDVAAAYPTYPQNTRAGWGYMLLTNFLPNGGNGAYNLLMFATDLNGHEVLLGNRSITCDNAHATLPFGAIDTPSQGGTASGTGYFNFGWALTPQPNSIPTDGSTIMVYVDGLPVGHPSYNHYRADIATQFPGFVNSNGAVGVFTLNTTAYTNAVHTIAWGVRDSAGNQNGIGSRYFAIQNVAGGEAAAVTGIPPTEEVLGLSADARTPIYVRKGMAADAPVETVFPEEDGATRIVIPEITRVAVYLKETDAAETEDRMMRRGARILNGSDTTEACYAAYELVLGQLRALPIGASFDSCDGVLYWHPGPGFLGEYVFVIIDKSANTRRTVKINILSK